MWIVSLDEYGLFENPQLQKSNKNCMVIGGTVYQCRPEDADRENDRLIRYFRKACSCTGSTFPDDLHPDHNGGYRNSSNVSKVKDYLKRTLPQFLQGTNDWAQNPPRGCYRLYAIIGDKNGMAAQGPAVTGNLVSDDVAGNRYEHMAYRILQNLLFYNSGCCEKDIRLDLATRVLRADEDKARKEVQQLGLWEKKNNTYRITDTESYRTMLLEASLDAHRSDFCFNLNVQSIQYDHQHLHQGFLWLADTVCSVYQDAISSVQNSGSGLSILYRRCGEMLKEAHADLWAYNPIDIIYRDAYRAFLRKADFEALKLIAEICRQRSVWSRIYDELWLKDLKERIVRDHKPNAVEIARLNKYLEGPDYNLSVAEEILEAMKRQCAGVENSEKNARILFELAKAEMTVRNHTGNFRLSARAYKQAMDAARYIPLEEYFELRNKMTVSLLDERKFDKALSFTQETLKYVRMQTGIKEKIYPGAKDNHIMAGRTLSQLGQCYAFLEHYSEANEKFREAIETFGDNSVEIGITRSYYLHSIIESGDRALYEQESTLYFGTEDPLLQIDRIDTLDDITKKFALYVYIKSLYCLYRNELDTKFTVGLTERIDRMFPEKGDRHPWEMILKYCALLRISAEGSKGKKTADLMIGKAGLSVEKEKTGIIPEIVQDGIKQYQACTGGSSDIFSVSEMTYMYR